MKIDLEKKEKEKKVKYNNQPISEEKKKVSIINL